MKLLQLFAPGMQRILESRDAASSAVQAMGLRRASQLAASMLGETAPREGEIATWQTETLGALMACMCHDPAGELPLPSQTDALKAALTFASEMPEVTHQQLLDLLSVFEAGVRVLGPSRHKRRFTALTAEEQITYLGMWEQSPFEPQRAAFHGLKSVCMMGYWTRPDTWAHIGYGLDTELEDTKESSM